jgi:hypothetical protein
LSPQEKSPSRQKRRLKLAKGKTASAEGKASPVTGGKEVEISSLGTLQSFKYQGKVYTKRKVHPGGVNALSIKGDKLIRLPPDTLVTSIG